VAWSAAGPKLAKWGHAEVESETLRAVSQRQHPEGNNGPTRVADRRYRLSVDLLCNVPQELLR
jgi:hypothetical protein